MDDKRVEREVRFVWKEEGERVIGDGEGTTTTQINFRVYLNRRL